MIKEILRLSKLDEKTLEQKGLKLSEECGEVSEAILSYGKVNGCGYKNKTADDVVEECVDVINVAMSIISQVKGHEVSIEEISQVFEKKIAKWESKVTSEKKDHAGSTIGVCRSCADIPIAKGIKYIECACCAKTSIVNIMSSVVLCSDCLGDDRCCMCGGDI